MPHISWATIKAKLTRQPTLLALGIFGLCFLSLAIANYHTNSWLLGWDALNPELYPFLNLWRALFPMWQANYGVGTLGGHGFAATLPDTLLAWALTLVLPVHLVRYVIIYLTWLLGSFGAYLLCLHVIESDTDHSKQNWVAWTTALIAGLWYGLNPGTMQIFFLPLEAFVFQFAGLPWIIWSSILFLTKPNKSRFLLFMVISWLSSVQGFVPSLFIAYALGLGCFLITYIVFSHNRIKSFLLASVLVLGTALANCYWLIPVGYYTLTQNQYFIQAYNNQISTPQFAEKSQQYGTLTAVLLQKSFFLDSKYQDSLLFTAWLTHYQPGVTQALLWSLILLAVVGLCSCWYHRKTWCYALTAFTAYFFVNLATQTPPFSWILTILYHLSPTYEQAFRTTFTKFGLGFDLGISIFLGVGIYYCLRVLRYYLPRSVTKILSGSLLGLLLGIVLFLGLPHWRGHSFFSQLQLQIPDAYQELLTFFKQRSAAERIADLPVDCQEGWYAYSWGYFGSGFLWYGLPQPVLSRSFSVWSPYTEGYHWEVTHALQTHNFEALQAVLEKYQVRWIVLDQNQRHCSNEAAFSYVPELLDSFKNSNTYRIERTWEPSGLQPFYLIERLNQEHPLFAATTATLPIAPEQPYSSFDATFQELGPYRSGDKPTVVFPFSRLLDRKGPFTKLLNLDASTQNALTFSYPVTNEWQKGTILLPAYNSNDPLFAKLTAAQQGNQINLTMTAIPPKIAVNGDMLELPESSNLLGSFPANNSYIFAVNQHAVELDTPFAIDPTAETLIRIFDQQGTLIFKASDSAQVLTENLKKTTMVPVSLSKGDIVTVTIPKVAAETLIPTRNLSEPRFTPAACGSNTTQKTSQFEIGYQETAVPDSLLTSPHYPYVRLTSQDTASCIAISLQDLDIKTSLLAMVTTAHHQGQPLLAQVTSLNGNQVVTTSFAPQATMQPNYFVLPKTEPYLSTLTLKNQSYSQAVTSNSVGEVALWAIPLDFLQKFRIFDTQQPQTEPVNSQIKIAQIFPSTYMIANPATVSATVAYHQGAHPGWIGFTLPDKKLLPKLLINGWENGWEVPPQQTIIVTFWPHFLGLLGYTVTGVTFCILLWTQGTIRHFRKIFRTKAR